MRRIERAGKSGKPKPGKTKPGQTIVRWRLGGAHLGSAGLRHDLQCFLAAIIFTLSLTAQPAVADFQAGSEAWDRGDYKTAVEEWEALVYENGNIIVGGNSAAQHNLGVIFELGLAGKKDATKAANLYRAAAENGIAKSQVNLAVIRIEGRGLKADPKLAFEYMKRAANQKNVAAMHNLSRMYYEGIGVQQDPNNASRLLLQTALMGHPASQYDLAIRFHEGDGVPFNDLFASALLILASKSEISEIREKARSSLKIARRELPNGVIEEATRVANRCLKSNYQSCRIHVD